MQFSFTLGSLSALILVLTTSHPLLLQVAFEGIGSSGLSSSDSGSASILGGGCGTAVRTAGAGSVGLIETFEIKFAVCEAGDWSAKSVSGLRTSCGVSSMVECVPVVHGGMTRNSSNVRTLALQHFHPSIPILAYTPIQLRRARSCFGTFTASHLSALREILVALDGRHILRLRL